MIGWLRRILYADGSEETPAVVLHVDNPEHPGEIALTGEDLALVGGASPVAAPHPARVRPAGRSR